MCAGRVEGGSADLGIVPVAEIDRQNLEWLPGTGIACRGAVRSILLVSRPEPRRIRTLATDAGSRTSVLLARMVLRERYGADPVTTPMTPQLGAMLDAADAALLIGDAALRVEPDSLSYHVLDLGREWWDMTGLPMVFALWSGRPGRVAELGRSRMERLFRDSLEDGINNINTIVAEETRKRGFSAPLVREYLTRHIRFRIGPEEERGLAEYLRQVRELSQVVTSC